MFAEEGELVRHVHHVQQRIQQQEEECDRLQDVQSGRMVWPLSDSKQQVLPPSCLRSCLF